MPARLLSYNVLSALDRVPRKFGASSGSRHLLGNLIGAVADEEFDDVEVEADTILDAAASRIVSASTSTSSNSSSATAPIRFPSKCRLPDDAPNLRGTRSNADNTL